MALGYESIDAAIGEWVERHGFTLSTSVEGFPEQDFRAVYLSSEKGECSQIWIDRPKSDQVQVHARDIETERDEEFTHEWTAPIGELPRALEQAVVHVRGWMDRK